MATQPNPEPRPDLRELEAGGLRLMLERQLQQYRQFGTIEEDAIEAMLQCVDVGREVRNSLVTYAQLVGAYQGLSDSLHAEMYATKDKLNAVMGCFDVVFDEELIHEGREEFDAGRGSDFILRIVRSIEHAAKRKCKRLLTT